MIKKLYILVMMLCLAGTAMADDWVAANVYGNNLDIALYNDTTYCAFQMDIKLPADISISEIAPAKIRINQNGSDQEMGDTKFIVTPYVYDTTKNIVRLFVYNKANKAITGSYGSNILEITLSEAPADPNEVTVSNVVFVAKYTLGAMSFADTSGQKGFARTDPNHDGYVNSLDINSVLNYMNAASKDCRNDINNDGYVNSLDINAVLKIMSGGN